LSSGVKEGIIKIIFNMSLYPLKLYFKHVATLAFLIISGLINLATWVWLLWQIRPQTEPVFLHYNILFGVDYVGEWWRVLALPIMGLLIILVNAILGWVLFNKDKFFASILNVMALFCQIFIFIAACLLVFLNV